MDDADDGTHVRAPTLEDVGRIGRSLNEAEARYVLIGGFAVIAHGSGRTTKDIDLLIDPSAENVARVKIGLGVLADNAAAEIEDNDVEQITRGSSSAREGSKEAYCLLVTGTTASAAWVCEVERSDLRLTIGRRSGAGRPSSPSAGWPPPPSSTAVLALNPPQAMVRWRRREAVSLDPPTMRTAHRAPSGAPTQPTMKVVGRRNGAIRLPIRLMGPATYVSPRTVRVLCPARSFSAGSAGVPPASYRPPSATGRRDACGPSRFPPPPFRGDLAQ